MTVTLSRVVSRDPDVDEEVTGELVAESSEWVELKVGGETIRYWLRQPHLTGVRNYTAWRVVSRG